MSSFGYREVLNKYEDIDEDELLASLTTEELQELERNISEIDPDENTPAGLRQWDQTAKRPSVDPFCRETLLKLFQNDTNTRLKTRRVEYWNIERNVDESQADKSEEERLSESDTEPSPETWALLNNKEEETKPPNRRHRNLKEMQNYNQILNTGYCKGTSNGRKTDVSNINVMQDRPSRNSTDIDGTLEKILRNDESVSEINLNNIENISQKTLVSFAEALANNTHVVVFSLANTRADDQVAFALASTLKNNCSITSLNIESNYVSGRGILALVRSLQQNSSLVELRFHNQRHICGGQVEMEMVKFLRDNTTLLKLGYHFDLPGPRMSATSILTRNQDRQRQTRLRIQRQNDTKDQTPHAITSRPTSNPQNISNTRPVTASQKQKHNPLPKHTSLPQLLSTQTEENVPNKKFTDAVNLQEESAAEKKGHDKLNTKMSNQTKESGHLIHDVKHAPKPSTKKKQEGQNGQRSAHCDLMAAIRSSHMATLHKVSVLQHQCS
ncbi:leiomodin-2a [Hoplias malabaricus]|uniref:leiomodin-2a n=1 Tax=Hoplias malabaricus TaxID=27720 RepID=UPI00346327C5